MTTNVQTPYNSYTGNGSVSIFTYTFQIGSIADIKVYFDGVYQPTGYSVSGVTNLGGGSITFTSPPANGVVVFIARDTTLDRTTDFTEGAALPSATLDNDLDRVVRQIQDVAANAVRFDNSGFNVTLPNSRITNVANPINAQDVATKSYVDTGDANAVAASSTYASNALASATASEVSRVASVAAKVAAEAARDSALSSLDTFDDRYLGAKTTDPTLDNDGNALMAGSLYYNSLTQIMKIYTGTLWVAAYVNGAEIETTVNTLAVLKAGSTMTGALTLNTNPTLNLHAATKQYVDSGISTSASTDATNLTNAINTTVLKAGSTMTGALTLSGDPTVNLHAATKQYADGLATTVTTNSVQKAGSTMTGALVLNADPAVALGAATKQYVDLRAPIAAPTFTGSATLSTSIDAAVRSYVINTNAGATASAGVTLTSNAGGATLMKASTAGGGYSAFWSTGGSLYVGTTDANDLNFRTNNVDVLRITSAGDAYMVGAGGFGYGTGTGGSVTQLTSKSTAVTLNTITGTITMSAAALAANTNVSFVVNNSLCLPTDLIVTNTTGNFLTNYATRARPAAVAGSFSVLLRNESASSLPEAVVINYAIIRGANT